MQKEIACGLQKYAINTSSETQRQKILFMKC